MVQNEDYRDIIKKTVSADSQFLRLTLSRKRDNDTTPWVKVTVRPVLIRGKRRLQFEYTDGKKVITKNYSGDSVTTHLDEVLSASFGNAHLQTSSADIHMRITRRGKTLITRGKPSCPDQQPDLTHDRVKDHLLPTGIHDPFLYALGVTSKEGQVRPGMRAKHHQINEFLRVIEQITPQITSDRRPINIVDCGSGSAYLTFAVYHYLHNICNLPVHVIGIEMNEVLTSKCSVLRDSLGWDGPEFSASRIIDFVPATAPDLVLCLHACDTATDEAIAQGILWGSKVILAAPCCQHELHNQLQVHLFRPVLRHGILRERLADILTDAFRALVLRIMGYETSIIEFVSPEHTAKNVMIRAELALKPGHMPSIREYEDLKRYWDVSPCIERLVGDRLQQLISKADPAVG